MVPIQMRGAHQQVSVRRRVSHTPRPRAVRAVRVVSVVRIENHAAAMASASALTCIHEDAKRTAVDTISINKARG